MPDNEPTASAVATPIAPVVAPVVPAAAGDEWDKDRAKATILKLREFERDATKQLKELEAFKAEKASADAAKLSETERLQKRLAEIEAKAADAERMLAEERRKGFVAQVAMTLGAMDPMDANIQAATASIDPASATVAEDVKQAIEALKASKPYLFKSGGGGRLESFNPGSATGSPETDQQRLSRIRRASGQGVGPLG